MSTDEIRTAAIEAGARAIHEGCNDWIPAGLLEEGWTPHGWELHIKQATIFYRGVLPLLVAGTASRIADAIEAEANRKPQGIREHLARDSFLTSREWLSYAASIARRVGETS